MSEPSAVCCTVCGSPDWIACAPGTAADATIFAYLPDVRELHPGVAVPHVAWCALHHPLLVRSADK